MGVAAGMWDRMLAFLGFEDEAGVEEPGELAGTMGAAAPARPLPRVELEQRRAARVSRTQPEPAAEVRGVLRHGNVTRLVPGLPGLVVSAPHRFEDAQEAADHLKGGRPVIVHLDSVDREVGQRIINFLMGAVYALGGEMQHGG